MKRFLEVAVLLLTLVGASSLKADDEITSSVISSLQAPQSSTAITYALNNVTPSVASASVDMSTYAGMLVGVSGSASSVQVMWSLDNSRFTTDISIPAGTTRWIGKQGRYVKFQVSSSGTWAGQKTSLWYVLQGSASSTVPYWWTAQSPAAYSLLSYGASTDVALPTGASFVLSTQGAAGLIYTVTTSATDPGSLTGTAQGTYVCMSNCTVVEGPYAAGNYLHMAASGGVASTGILRLVK